jgi:hypothetical protein
VFAKEADGLKSGAAKSVAIRDLGGKAIAKAEVNHVDTELEIDTGNGGAFDLFERFTTAHNLPGSLKSAEQKGRFSAGAEETVRRLFRLPQAKLGPIEVKSALASIDAPPGSGAIAGLIGNSAFARCKALVFDLSHRKIWFEPPCDRPMKESRAGWRLVRQDDESQKDRPWVLSGIIRGASADKAGLQNGDRLLELGGKPATLDLDPLVELVERPSGTKLAVVVMRGNEKKTATMVLADLLSE